MSRARAMLPPARTCVRGQAEEIMAKHTVHKSTATGNFVLADDKGTILHTFPTEGEANLQVIALAEAEKAAKGEAKAEAKHEDDDEAANNKSGAKPGLRHR